MKSTSRGATSRLPKASRRTACRVSCPPAARTNSTSPGCQPARPPAARVSGLYFESSERGSPRAPTSPAAVAMKATPHTRSSNSSGNSAASSMITMPPIECPISTMGPSGTTDRSTQSRSRASCSIVEFSAEAAPDRPWPRWS